MTSQCLPFLTDFSINSAVFDSCLVDPLIFPFSEPRFKGKCRTGFGVVSTPLFAISIGAATQVLTELPTVNNISFLDRPLLRSFPPSPAYVAVTCARAPSLERENLSINFDILFNYRKVTFILGRIEKKV